MNRYKHLGFGFSVYSESGLTPRLLRLEWGFQPSLRAIWIEVQVGGLLIGVEKKDASLFDD